MKQITGLSLVVLTAVTALSSMTSTPVLAGDDFNDWSCQALWEERNQIYKDAGYCFHTPRAIKRFGNAGCEYDSESEVPLSKADRRNVKAMKRAENAKGC